MKNNKNNSYRPLIKMIVCIIHIIVIVILAFCSFRIYQSSDKVVNFSDTESVDKYVYLDVSEMSKKVAEIDNGKKQLHFVIEKLNNGKWYTYLTAINKDDVKKFKSMIEYSETSTDKVPKKIRIYGYKRKITSDIKNKALKNADTFFSNEKKKGLSNNNFEKYFTNYYLDSTVKKHHSFNYFMLILMLMLVVLFITLILVIFDKDKLVDEVDKIAEESLKKKIKKEEKEARKNIKKVKRQLKEEKKKNKTK